MMVEVDQLTKVFKSRRRAPVTAVEDASFKIDKGEIVGLLGT
jgi:ABC-type Na+ transport system ATPase subunit NatA